MSIEQLNTTALGATDVTLMAAAIDKNSKGLAQITVSEYDTDAACVVKAGSVFECNGATFLVSGTDETPTGYSGITVSTTFYLYYDESEDEFTYLETAPTWSDSLQGWYNGNDRAFFSMYKDSTGLLYEHKNLIEQESNSRLLTVETINVNELSISGEILPSLSSSGIYSAVTTTPFYIPRGFHMLTATDPSRDFHLEIKVSGTWRRYSETFQSQTVMSDGSNVRIYSVATALTTSVYYVKF